ncbi:Transcriptional repressor scratch 1 [Nymphon striatum]|nr:Transcriptional repressor scratch 1 [Nymphon striatum]
MFNLSGSMYNHYRNKHINVARKSCPHCSKTFAWDTGLSKHLKEYHPDLHPQLTSNNFQCQICNRIFVLEKIEKRTCPVCGQIFNRICSMYNHCRNKHRNTDRIQCKYCSKMFAWDSNLKTHIKTFHANKLSDNLNCRFCLNKFVLEVDLIKHMEQFHPYNQ